MTLEEIMISKKSCLLMTAQHNTKIYMIYSKCSSILVVLGNVPQYSGYPGYQLLEALFTIIFSFISFNLDLSYDNEMPVIQQF